MPLLPIQLSNLLSQVSISGAALAFFNRCTLWKACIEPRNPISGHPNTQNWTVLIVFSFILSCFSWKQTKFQYHYFFICLPAQWRLELKAYLRNKYLRTQAKQWGGTCLNLQSMAREPVWPHKKQSRVFSPRKIPLAQESPKASGHQLLSLKLQSKKKITRCLLTYEAGSQSAELCFFLKKKNNTASFFPLLPVRVLQLPFAKGLSLARVLH